MDNFVEFCCVLREKEKVAVGYRQLGNVAANVSCRGLEINLRETAHHPSCGVIVGVVMEDEKKKRSELSTSELIYSVATQ